MNLQVKNLSPNDRPDGEGSKQMDNDSDIKVKQKTLKGISTLARNRSQFWPKKQNVQYFIHFFNLGYRLLEFNGRSSC